MTEQQLFPIEFDLGAQIDCIEREIRQRQNVYPRLVADKRMTQNFADTQIALMRAVLATLQAAKSARPPGS